MYLLRRMFIFCVLFCWKSIYCVVLSTVNFKWHCAGCMCSRRYFCGGAKLMAWLIRILRKTLREYTINKGNARYTGLFEIIVGDLTTCHKQHSWDRSMCIFYLIEQHSKFLLHAFTDAIYVHPLWFFRHQHDNRVRSKLFVAHQRCWFQWRFWLSCWCL